MPDQNFRIDSIIMELVLPLQIMQEMHAKGNRVYVTDYCQRNLEILSVLGLGAFIISYAPDMRSVPWIINTNNFPVEIQGNCSG